jgi:hypothetical protein
MATKQLIVIVSVLTMMVGGLSCGYVYNSVPGILELSDQKVTLEEASEIIGRPVPVPTYLPDGYAIQEVYAHGKGMIMLLISDKEIEKKLVTHTDAAGTRQWYELRCPMTMQITWAVPGPPGIKLPGKRVDINTSRGVILGRGIIQDRGDYNALWWHWAPDPVLPGRFELVLSAGKRVSSSTLVKIAESVQY